MDVFEQAYRRLNAAQKRAVDTIDGPLLVVAGPGTGKTQLLSARVAQILRKTDTLAQNILCLTFTESGAANMRDRLSQFIGSDAYDVAIATYHSFGGDIIRRFPEYFIETRLERPIDELGKRQILSELIDAMRYDNPLKQTRWHLGDLVATMSEVKRGLLTADSLRLISEQNIETIQACSPAIDATLGAYAKRLPSKLTVSQPLFEAVLHTLQTYPVTTLDGLSFEPLATLAAQELERALLEAQTLMKTTPLTKWKNSWLAKDSNNQFVLAGQLEAARMQALARVLEDYQQALDSRGLYDFDDMILRAIRALEQNPDLKYSLQEQYQYILLDEFQDTNAAQLRLVELLTDNPVHEGRPNVLAVGDDDQAIYAFQGAQYSNMLDFFALYRDVLVVNLSENYRSTEPLVLAARKVADQITDSLAVALPELDKQLLAASPPENKTVLRHIEYASDVAERAGVAAAVAELVTKGTAPSDIAILAPKHRYLEPLVPYLQDHQLAVSYERRENILDAPAIRELLAMSRLVIALHDRNQAVADSLWPEILSYRFWGHAVADIWKLSWQAADSREPWTKLLLDNTTFRPCALLFAALAGEVITQPLEIVLDRLIGTEDVVTGDATTPTIRSPFREYYAGPSVEPDSLYRVVTELAVLRAKLREHEQQRGEQLNLIDLLAFVSEYEAAGQRLLNTSPYNQATDAVQLMTVFKAKGLEFKHVFLLHTQDAVWGPAAVDLGNKLTLPANLAPIRHSGTTEDERVRLLFVAMTRAKSGLHLSSHAATYAGKEMTRLKYLQEAVQVDGVLRSAVLPPPYDIVDHDDRAAPPLSAIEHDWRSRHLHHNATLQSLLQDRLRRYRISPTHLTQFVDLEHAGPQAFLLQTLLKFPAARSIDASFGNAMHGTLEWIQQAINRTGNTRPPISKTQQHFSDLLSLQGLYGEQFALQEARGHEALVSLLAKDGLSFKPGDKPEYNFTSEGVVINNQVLMSGKIDLLQIDETNKRITIVDYKTGAMGGTNTAKLHRYELQLYCYKLLLAGSHSFANYEVNEGKLLFVEPASNNGKIVSKVVHFDPVELMRVQKLLTAVWSHIESLQLPDITGYNSTLTAIRQFEDDLINGNA